MNIKSQEKPWICVECNKIFSRNYNLQRHILLVHTGEKPVAPKKCSTILSQKNHSKYRMGDITHAQAKLLKSCKKCNKVFSRNYNLQRHILLVHTGEKPVAFKECDKIRSQDRHSKIRMNILAHETPFTCLVCKKIFTRNYNLQRHILLVHTGEKPVASKKCSTILSQKKHSEYRMRNPTDERVSKLLTCKECNRLFPRTFNLRRHILRMHTDVKPVVFEDRIKTLNSVKKSHSDEQGNIITTQNKPFICLECKKTFSKEFYLQLHVRMAHAVSGEKPFACCECNKIFSSNKSLVSHWRSHTCEKPFACTECDKSFRRMYQLKNHTRTHTGEKPFVCSICNNRYSMKNHLKEHFLIKHPGETLILGYIRNKTSNGSDRSPLRASGSTICETTTTTSADSNKFIPKKEMPECHRMLGWDEKPFACGICCRSFSTGEETMECFRTHESE